MIAMCLITTYLTSTTLKLRMDCHREVPHGRVNSLSGTPGARVPLPPSPVPGWSKELTIIKMK
jgi:cytochrome c nitrite reductase small subunit